MPHQRRHNLTRPASLVFLTRREVEILQLAALGRTNREIAQKLVISYETVRCHLYNAYRKLGANNRTIAIVRAVHLGAIRVEQAKCKQN